MTRLLVTGGRDYQNALAVDRELSGIWAILTDDLIVIHGGAQGADTLAMRWCYAHGVHAAAVPALWDYYSRSAGPKRNSAMLLLQPTLVLAFPGGAGTADMIEQARSAGVPVREVRD